MRARVRTDLGCAVRAAERPPIRFDAMTDDAAAAMVAFGGQRVNRTFKAVERVDLAVYQDLEGLLVFVPANFAASHDQAPFTS